MARRTKLEANLTRECLVRAASELFEKQGFRDTTVSDIVRLAGTTKGALFHHFENKEALFFEIYKRLQARMDEAARSAAREALDPGDPGRAFLVGCRAYLEWTQRPDYQRIILIDGPVVLDEIEGGIDGVDLGREAISAGISYLQRNGLAETELLPAMRELLYYALNGAGLSILRQQPGVTIDSVIALIEKIMRKLNQPSPAEMDEPVQA